MTEWVHTSTPESTLFPVHVRETSWRRAVEKNGNNRGYLRAIAMRQCPTCGQSNMHHCITSSNAKLWPPHSARIKKDESGSLLTPVVCVDVTAEMYDEFHAVIGGFVSGRRTNEWLALPEHWGIEVYARRSRRVHPTKNYMLDCFDISSLNVRNQGLGLGSAFCSYAVHQLNFPMVMIENIMWSQWADRLRLHGWEDMPSNDGISTSLYYLK